MTVVPTTSAHRSGSGGTVPDLAAAIRGGEEARSRLLAADTARDRVYAMEDCSAALERLLAALRQPASGLCSAHREGDAACPICYPAPPAPLPVAVVEAAEIVCERLVGTGGDYYRQFAPGLMDDIAALRAALDAARGARR